MKRPVKRLVSFAFVLLGASVLAACGLKGDLATPGPLWGEKERAVVERDLPSQGGDETQIVFTRDDVDLFRDEEEEDPFAEDDEEELPLGPESDLDGTN